ncbi:hypothetical protein AQ962_02445 [Burkholderia pseudomallei]|nr:hypothetical protein AQ724_02880 [Burkholderia pseudomallei]OMW23041.1 hypothetical protein AQ805_27655 [Burkholderia pseudomallei]OMW28961.1 hypothetical protein AQ804_13350 [Burkholderia pseudomallei]ONF00524.1 hypothetical protein AQ961_12715 [Burkholderia pseudomallei]ONF14717.1 hypothetical protein AQ962_02445 [Burkholderia pseudomallei]
MDGCCRLVSSRLVSSRLAPCCVYIDIQGEGDVDVDAEGNGNGNIDVIDSKRCEPSGVEPVERAVRRPRYRVQSGCLSGIHRNGIVMPALMPPTNRFDRLRASAVIVDRTKPRRSP